MKTMAEICAEYAPYDKMDWFKVGWVDYELGKFDNPCHPGTVGAQAWDRGMEAHMRYARQEATP